MLSISIIDWFSIWMLLGLRGWALGWMSWFMLLVGFVGLLAGFRVLF